MALWGGRFAGQSSEMFKALNDSLVFDRILVMHDIAGSVAWAKGIAKAGVLSKQELAKLLGALEDLRKALIKDPTIIERAKDEDVHSFVERELIARVGDLGKKLHTGRSRNDQVATDVRLFCMEQVGELQRLLVVACEALIGFAEQEWKSRTVLPGYTHLQRGQPVLLAHWAMAYVEMFRRDFSRFEDSLARIGVSPLGSGALAGTAYRVDREQIAKDLGMIGASRNSLDSVSDRDFIFEVLANCALTGVHLSRLGEDLVLYSSQEFGFVQMSDKVTSGSSLMPQKKNPDSAELLRGKCGRLMGNLVTLGTSLKGLALAYNKDLQEDKEPLFDSLETLDVCLRIVPECFAGMTVNRQRMNAAADDGLIAATDLADYLVSKSVPFREAHHVSGQIVRAAVARSCGLAQLTLAQMREIDGRIEQDVYERLTIASMLAARDVVGGTNVSRVASAMKEARRWAKRARR